MIISPVREHHLKKTDGELREEFYRLRDFEDVAKLLEVSDSELADYLYNFEEDEKYQTFTIPKRSGGVREISAPISQIKYLQWKLNQVLQIVYDPKPSAHGFVLEKNIVTNAQAHAGKRFILNLDLKDFFPSIHFGRVRELFMAEPYELPSLVATTLAELCCYHNRLPQGSPTSPVISNMICAKMDVQFQSLAKNYQCTYTRYADDLTFSTTRKKFPSNLAVFKGEEHEKQLLLGEAIIDIITENGFAVNFKKVRLQSNDHHQEVTGLTSNEFPNVRRTLIREVRAMLHAWRKYGLENAERHYRQKKDMGRAKHTGSHQFQLALRGKINFIGMVRGEDDEIYQKYLHQYEELLNDELP